MSAGRGRCAKQCRVPEAKLYKDSVSPPAPQASGEVCQLLSVLVGFSPVYASILNTAFAKPRRVLLPAPKRIHYKKFKVGRVKVIHEEEKKQTRKRWCYQSTSFVQYHSINEMCHPAGQCYLRSHFCSIGTIGG